MIRVYNHEKVITEGTCWMQEINNVLLITPLSGTTIAANTVVVLDIRFLL
jgi:hypothetical protein